MISAIEEHWYELYAASATVDGSPAKAYAIALLSAHDNGVMILAAVGPQSYSQKYQVWVEEIAKSMQFSQPQLPEFVQNWKQELSGSKLTYLWSYSSRGYGDGSYAGGSQETVIELCPQEYFFYKNKSRMSIDGGYSSGYNVSGYSHGNTSGQGRWEVTAQGQQPVLRLYFMMAACGNFDWDMKTEALPERASIFLDAGGADTLRVISKMAALSPHRCHVSESVFQCLST